MPISTEPVPTGGYRFAPYQFQYSAGAVAEPGFRIERARFAKLMPLAEGFAAIEAYLAKLGRPPTAFCACELRSPKQFSEAGFIAFNRVYVQQLEKWGLFHNDINSVARSNVCLEIDPPATPSFYAFCYAVPGGEGGFVAAGSGEAKDGPGTYAERIVSYRDQSPAGMRAKARCVLEVMEHRMGLIGKGWSDVTATQVYTVFDVHSYIADEFVKRGTMAGGLVWHFARPPVEGLDFEVDVRGVTRELVI